MAWLHDLLEDCDGLTDEKLNQELVTAGVLPVRAEELVGLVRLLTKEKGEGEAYFQRIQEWVQWQVSLVKLLDRIANLREGSKVFTERRWRAYVEETERYVLPLISRVDGLLHQRILLELGMAMVGRPRRCRTCSCGSGEQPLQ